MALKKLKEVQVGMVLEKDVLTPKGQIIAKAGSVLNAQTLLHMSFYNIDSLEVEENKEPVKEAPKPAKKTMFDRIRESEDFKVFQKNYLGEIDSMKDQITDFVNRKGPLNADKMLNSTKKLFEDGNTNFGLITMLHTLRNIDDSTFAHSMNVSIIARIIGKWLDYSDEDLDKLALAGLMHDMGKAMIPREIIQKPDRLSPGEYSIIKKHPEFGYSLLKDEDVPEEVKLATLEHHERCDGTGYPFKKTRGQIHGFSSIIAIADVYDAMTADRCYRLGICPFEVLANLQRNGMDWFPPQYLLTFLSGIAETYVDSSVVLSDDRTGRIVMIPQAAITRPIIQLDDGDFIALQEHTNLTIKAIL